MLYEAIRLGCEIYHKSDSSYDEAYTAYLNSRDASKWDNPETLDYEEVYRLMDFANKWKCRMPSGSENIKSVLAGLKWATPDLNRLNRKDLLNIQFDQNIKDKLVRQLIQDSFNNIANAGRRYESVATSKMIHAAINPRLFVMWDNAIQQGLAYRSNNGGKGYTQFLLGIQRRAKRAISETMNKENLTCEDSIKFLTPCDNSLAKVMDEYNYVKYTLKNPVVREMERRV